MANKTQKKYLALLASMLELHHDNEIRFNLASWRHENAEADNWCGTTACACGLAAITPTFMQAGLGVSGSNVLTYTKNGVVEAVNWCAVMQFFGVSEQAALWLFSVETHAQNWRGDKAARAVAKRIHSYLAKGERAIPKS